MEPAQITSPMVTHMLENTNLECLTDMECISGQTEAHTKENLKMV